MIAMLIKKKGGIVIHADYSEARLAVSKQLGTDITVDLNNIDDPVKELRALTPGGRGADVTIDATGVPEAWENCINIVRKAGFVNLFGGCKSGTSVNIDTHRIHYDGLTISGFFHTTPKHVMIANDLINRHEISEDIFVTAEYPLEKIVDAIEAHGRQEGIKNAILYE